MSHWQEITLGEACELYQPKTISATEMVDDGDYPVYGANGIVGKYDKFNHAEPQLLITCRGATCGAVNVSLPNSWINGNAMVVKPRNSSIQLKFLEHLFRGGVDLQAVITGAAQPQITRQSLAPLKIRVPPLSEQTRIATILDQADELRVKRREALVQLDNLAQSIFIDIFGDPATNPNKWKTGTVKDALESGWLVEIQDGNHGERHPKVSDFLTDGIPFIMANCLVEGQLDTNKAYKLDPSWLKRLRVGFAKPNDLLLSHKGTVGEVAIVPSTYADVILSPQTTYYRTSDKLDVKFLAGYFQTRWFQSILENEAKQSTRAYIGIIRQQLLPMIFPPLNLQNEYARRLDCVGNLREKFRVGIAELDVLFASLQYRAFQGEP